MQEHNEHTHSHEHEEEDPNKALFKIIAGGIFFAVSFPVKALNGPVWLWHALLALSYLILGYEVIFNAIKNLFSGNPFDEQFLMTLATIGAAVLGEYTEAVFVMLFYCIGEFAQDLAVDRSRENIEQLMDIEPETARLVHPDGTVTEVPPSEVKPGSVIQVLTGEMVPIDGVISEGTGTFDTKAITGESVPLTAGKGEAVLSGSIVLNAPVFILTEKEYQDSTVSKILKLVEESQEKKAPTERFITRFARVYTPIVTGLAVLLAVVPSLITGNWAEWTHRALTFLVISCPCALVLSVPLAFFAGIGSSARSGILVKGGTHLETLARTQAVVFDKTGTLTHGIFSVTEVCPAGPYSSETLLQAALSLERNSRHPAANAVTAYCAANGITTAPASDVEEHSGMGLTGLWQGRKVLAGNLKLLTACGIKPAAQANALTGRSGTLVHVALGENYLGFVEINDTIKENVPQSITELKKLGIKKTVMLSGDSTASAEKVAKQAGLDICHAQLLPQDKVQKLNELKKQYVCTYAGDGINDAPVLAAADTGIAMGGAGSASAVEAAGIVLMSDDISKIPLAIRTAKKTMLLAKENIAFALAVKVIAMILGALGITGMAVAVFADTGVALLCVLNSLRALRSK